MYLSADEDEDYKITHAGIDIDDKGFVQDQWVAMRYMNKFIEGPVEDVQYIDVLPQQVVGTSASLIPFIARGRSKSGPDGYPYAMSGGSFDQATGSNCWNRYGAISSNSYEPHCYRTSLW